MLILVRWDEGPTAYGDGHIPSSLVLDAIGAYGPGAAHERKCEYSKKNAL
jgi:hypothetical protein